MDKYQMDPKATKIKILSSSVTEKLGGTSAELLAGDLVSIHDLMFGMMLPSGNDAAQSLAIYFGNLQLMLRSTSNFNMDSNVSKQMLNYVQNIDANIYEDQFDPPEYGPYLEG
jgi:D-alanyl-D-alanine carboxypeptidase